jgi:hypothetical protein
MCADLLIKGPAETVDASSRSNAEGTHPTGCTVLLDMNRIRLLAGLLSLLCAACTSTPTTQVQGGGRSLYEHIRFERPTGWLAVPVTFNTASFTPDAYWTNQPTVPECRPNPRLGGHTSCGPPVAELTTGGVLVIVVNLPTPASSFHANARVADHAASIRRTDCSPQECPARATSGLLAMIRIPGRPSRDLINTLQLQAYFGPGNAGQPAEVMRRVLDDARSG